MQKGLAVQFSNWIVQFTSLRARLLLLLLLTLLPVYGFILYSVIETRQQAEDNAKGDALSLMRLVALEQKNLIEVTRQQLLTIAKLPSVRHPNQVAQCNSTFAEILAQNASYANLGVIDIDGTLRCSGLPLTSRVKIADRDYFREALRTRAFTIGGYQIGSVSGKGSATLAYPVLDETGKPRAVVFIALNLSMLSAQLSKAMVLPEGSMITIVNDQGTILARQPDPGKWVGQLLPDAPLFEAMRKLNQEGSMQTNGVDGVERLHVFAPFHSSPTNSVYVSVDLPISAVLADAQQLFSRALLLMALVTAVVIASAWFGSRVLVLQPMEMLIRAARRLGLGDLSVRTNLPHTWNECGQLAKSLDEMAISLQAHQSQAVRANARFINIIELSEDAIISMDEEQRILIFNKGAEHIFGYTAAEMIGQPLGKLLPERFAATHHHHIRRFATEPVTVRNMDKRPGVFGRHKDGSEFFAEARISRMTEDDKSIFTVYLRDISERKRTEQMLQQKDQLLTMVGSMAQVGGWELDPRTQEVKWTDVVANIYGMDPRDSINVETGLRLYQGESRKRIEAAIQNAMQYGHSFDLELEITTPNGTHKWIRAIAQAIQENGTVVKVWGSVQDITEHKHAAEEIRQLNINLEGRILERTTELATANKELEAFSYSVSHDLRAPLRSIDGFSQALLDDYTDQLDDQAKNYLSRVRAATQRMGNLIDDMLTLSQITRADMQRMIVDLSALATNVLAELQTSEPERKVDCRVEPKLVAKGDAQLLRVALVNLLGNAWKFTGKTKQARIEFGAMHNANATTDFFVRDNGAGFDMAYASKLFGAFQRLHLASEFPGTGVGLATVQRIVHRHGGQTRGEGVPGQGATFYFTLPN